MRYSEPATESRSTDGTGFFNTASPVVMGIININDDSFYKASRSRGKEEFISRFTEMLCDGAGIVDIGACSTRPGSRPISEEQEEEALIPMLSELVRRWEEIRGMVREKAGVKAAGAENVGSLISVDTFRSGIVRKVFDLTGRFAINDISSGEDDPDMLRTVGKLGLPYIAMHKRGDPATMQTLCDYPEGVVEAVLGYFRRFGSLAAETGIAEWALDPGFGFAKTIGQNYEMMARLEEFRMPGHPLLVGISRKSMIWRLLGITPEESLPQTTALNLLALSKGADILRVHDVREAVSCLKMHAALSNTAKNDTIARQFYPKFCQNARS